jgi:hypothetical protein
VSAVECVGEFETATSRGKPITRVIWERPCTACGAFFRLTLPKGAPTFLVDIYSTTCPEHSADKRTRKAKRSLRVKYRSPNRKRYGKLGHNHWISEK